ncbi:MAG TPA: LuxR family transcriptional regulator [Anaerolineales bacterium]|nr:LuxR family transcriptional regulator [Anaerolineales bacterium]HLO29814.1 LuxR family transcriptional regulator [Anaerolineales bacterium]
MAQFNRLSSREWQVLKLLLQGKSNKLIASSLGISKRTVEFHLKNIYAKCEVNSRVELILKLANTTGAVAMAKLGQTTVDEGREIAENRDRLNSRRDWATSFRDAVSTIGKESEMKNLLNSKHVLVGVITAISTGVLWVSTMLYSQTIPSYEFKGRTVPLIVVWVMIGLSVGLIGKHNGSSLRRVFFGALFGTGLSPFLIIPLMLIVVLPLGKLAEWFGLIDPATMSNDAATILTTVIMITIWLVVGIAIGISLLFVSFRKPEQASVEGA